MKQKRRERKERALLTNATPEEEEDADELESSLTTGHRMVQKKYDYEYRRFGDPFARGDSKSTMFLSLTSMTTIAD